VIRITIMGNMRPPSELMEMIRGGGWYSGGCTSMKIMSFGSRKPLEVAGWGLMR